MIISITGLKPKSVFTIIPFWLKAIPSLSQAKNAKGNLHCEVKKIKGIQHTLTAWESEEALKNFVYSGIHLKAIQSFRKIATGSTYRYKSETMPSWDEARRMWEENYREY